MKEHDYETETLTEHQRRNRDAMSRKMSEMSKLQNTLTNQAKVKCFKIILKYCRLYRNDFIMPQSSFKIQTHPLCNIHFDWTIHEVLRLLNNEPLYGVHKQNGGQSQLVNSNDNRTAMSVTVCKQQ